ncbi:MAG: Na+/H+ antiporter subunit D [Desulfuromonadales bacterium]|nr:Na+/H+ antiporter subunit D [Desulfuromonadales bacterium]
MINLLFLPLVIPLATAVACLLAWKNQGLQRIISLIGSFLLLIAAAVLLVTVQQDGVLSVQGGGWAAPFGITLVADLFSALMVCVAAGMGLVVAIYSLADTEAEYERLGYHPLMQVLMLGVCGSFLTGDIFNLYVWFETMLIASFVLLAMGGKRAQMEGAIKYVVLNLIASALFLAAVGILYGVAGTLNMADLARMLRESESSGPIPVIAILFFIAFGIKAAVFPLFFWLPASYHTAPMAVTTIFSALLTKVGVYALIRIFTLVFFAELAAWQPYVLAIAGLTMVIGVLGAVAQDEMRRLLSFHIVSQIGYLIMGLGLLTPLALGGAIYFMVHVIAAKSALFLATGMVLRLTGTTELKKLGGLYRHQPLLAGLFLVAALALAGIPPLSGFWAKLALIWSGLESGNHYLVVAVALLVSLLTLFSMTKIWAAAFWKGAVVNGATDTPLPLSRRVYWQMAVPTALLTATTVLIGLWPEPLYALCMDAARQLLVPDAYIFAVLGVQP